MFVKSITLFFLVFVFSTEAQLSYKSGHCPLRLSVNKCMPKCVSDYECGFNEKCCPNICGSHSCALPNAVNTGSEGGYKGSSRDNGVYCNGQRCSQYEKCEFDRKTKRERCIRT